MTKPVERLKNIKSENEQLVSIIAKSIETAKKNHAANREISAT